MYYNGNDYNLRGYLQIKEKEYDGDSLDWFEEGIIWAIQSYLSSMGDFSADDIECIKENGFAPEDFFEETLA